MKEKLLALVLAVLSIFILYKGIIAGHSMPIFEAGSISEYRKIELGNSMQSILIRGKDKTNPVLLYLHGGPGNPETSYIIPYQKEWEKYYTVVNWDQRGSGRSFDHKLDKETLTTEQICLDAIELTEYLRNEFRVDKIYIVGHSYGTYVGMKCIQRNPDYYYAYVGLGQIANQQENEKILLSYAAEMANKHHNEKALKELASLGELPYEKADFGRKISLSRKWTTYYGGAMYGKKDTSHIYAQAIVRPEYSVLDLINFLRGDNLYFTNTESDTVRWEFFNANLHEEIPSVEVPVYFIQGENDYITSYEACEKYFDELCAPYKKMILLSECAHDPIVEKTEEVSKILIEEVLRREDFE